MRQQQPAHLHLEEDVWEGLVVKAVFSQHQGFDERGGGAVVRQARLFVGGNSQQLELQVKTGEVLSRFNSVTLTALQAVSEVSPSVWQLC